jgi:hypothetical protein
MKTIRERIKEGEFNSKVKYPTRPKAPSGYNATIESLLNKAPKDSELEVLTNIGKEYSDYTIQVKEYNKAVDAWRQSEKEGIINFRKALEKENGLINHPKAEDLWIKAWDKGRSSGLNEVAWEYEDLLVLVI